MTPKSDKHFFHSVVYGVVAKMAVHLRSAIELLILFVVCQLSSAVLPSYIGNWLIGIVERTDLIKHYFSLDLQYSEILAFLLSFHGIQLSLR